MNITAEQLQSYVTELGFTCLNSYEITTRYAVLKLHWRAREQEITAKFLCKDGMFYAMGSLDYCSFKTVWDMT